jgi:mRNA interferase MazF
MTYTQYDLFLVNLDPTIGSEIKKTRPCVVLSPNELNNNLNTLIIAPIKSTSKPYPTRLQTKSVKPYGWIALDQIRTIDKKRITKKIGQLSPDEISACKRILEELLVW